MIHWRIFQVREEVEAVLLFPKSKIPNAMSRLAIIAMTSTAHPYVIRYSIADWALIPDPAGLSNPNRMLILSILYIKFIISWHVPASPRKAKRQQGYAYCDIAAIPASKS